MTRDRHPDAAVDPLVELGRIIAAHGLKGWVKVQPYSTQASALLRAKQWWLVEGGQAPEAITVQTARLQGHAVVAQLQDVVDRNQAEALRGRVVCMPRSAFPQPDANEYYWVDLIGCLLYGTAPGQPDSAGQPMLLGRVTEVSDNGAHALLKVARLSPQNPPDASPLPILDTKGRPAELLVPFVAAHVHGVDLAARRIDTNWPADF